MAMINIAKGPVNKPMMNHSTAGLFFPLAMEAAAKPKTTHKIRYSIKSPLLSCDLITDAILQEYSFWRRAYHFLTRGETLIV
jgi:hypothetical protein